jgi:hypothetical protein
MSRRIEDYFTYHAPKEHQVKKYEEIRRRAKEFALFLEQECPDTRELEFALQYLRSTVMWANASIACHDKP